MTDDFPKFRVVEQYEDFGRNDGLAELILWTAGTVLAFAAVSVVMWWVG